MPQPKTTPKLFCVTENGDEIIEYDVLTKTTIVHSLQHYLPSLSRYCLLPDHRLLSSGGRNRCSQQREIVGSVYIFDPREGAVLRSKSPMRNARFGHALVQYESWVFAISGSCDGLKATKSCERFNYHSDQWNESASMLLPRLYAGVCSLKNKLYVTGGSYGFTAECVRLVEVFDVPLATWAVLDVKLPVSVWGHGCVAYEGGVFVFGGVSFDGQSSTACFLVSTTDKRIRQKPGLPSAGEFLGTVQAWEDGVCAIESGSSATLFSFVEGKWSARPIIQM